MGYMSGMISPALHPIKQSSKSGKQFLDFGWNMMELTLPCIYGHVRMDTFMFLLNLVQTAFTAANETCCAQRMEPVALPPPSATTAASVRPQVAHSCCNLS